MGHLELKSARNLIKLFASSKQHNTTQHNTTQHSTTQHNTTQHNTTQHNTTQQNKTKQNKTLHYTTQHNTTQHNTTQHNTTQHNTSQHNTTQHNTTKQNKTKQNTTLHYTTQHNTTLHNTPQHSTTQHNTTQRSTTQHNKTKQNKTKHYTTQHNTTQHTPTHPNTTQHNTTQHNAMYADWLPCPRQLGSGTCTFAFTYANDVCCCLRAVEMEVNPLVGLSGSLVVDQPAHKQTPGRGVRIVTSKARSILHPCPPRTQGNAVGTRGLFAALAKTTSTTCLGARVCVNVVGAQAHGSVLTLGCLMGVLWSPKGRDAFKGKRPQKRLDRRLEEVAKSVGGGYCRLRMPLQLALGVRGT